VQNTTNKCIYTYIHLFCYKQLCLKQWICMSVYTLVGYISCNEHQCMVMNHLKLVNTVFGANSQYSDLLRAGWSGCWIPGGSRFSAPVLTGSEAPLASYTMGTGSFPGVSNQDVALTTHTHLAPRLKKE